MQLSRCRGHSSQESVMVSSQRWATGKSFPAQDYPVKSDAGPWETHNHIYMENLSRVSKGIWPFLFWEEQQNGEKSDTCGSEAVFYSCSKKCKVLSCEVAQLFILMPTNLRNSDHGDIEMFKNQLDHYLACIYQMIPLLTATSNSLVHQAPLYVASSPWLPTQLAYRLTMLRGSPV